MERSITPFAGSLGKQTHRISDGFPDREYRNRLGSTRFVICITVKNPLQSLFSQIKALYDLKLYHWVVLQKIRKTLTVAVLQIEIPLLIVFPKIFATQPPTNVSAVLLQRNCKNTYQYWTTSTNKFIVNYS